MNLIKKYGFLALSIVSLILVLLILFLPKFLPERLPLFYSLPWGEGQLAEKVQFLIIPTLSLSIALLNLLISHQLHFQQILLKQVLQVASILCGVVLILNLVKIIFIFI